MITSLRQALVIRVSHGLPVPDTTTTLDSGVRSSLLTSISQVFQARRKEYFSGDGQSQSAGSHDQPQHTYCARYKLQSEG
jgi:hypothetical protein